MDNSALSDFVSRVRESSDIVNVVSSYVPLKKKSGRFWGCCPFHHEKTPSFSVDPVKGFFYCFGCHVGGDVFGFISKIENIRRFDAIKKQAEALGIPLPEREKTPEEQQRDEYFNRLREVMSRARDYFHSCLTKTPLGENGLKYWASRGINEKIITDFSLGFAPDSYDKFHRAFLKRGYDAELLLTAGLVKKSERSHSETGVYDMFRNRVMIPIADERGRVVAFGGRVIGDGEPKYLNSPQTPIFNKRRLLFGLDRAGRAIRNANYAVMVEGYMDAVSLFANGINNVVASLGTAFTVEQCRLVLRYAPEIYFCYDSDEAGQKATLRALEVLRATGAKAKVLVVPDGKDPDEFIRRNGREAFLKLIASAKPIVDYQLDYVFAHADLASDAGRRNALDVALPVLHPIKGDAALFNSYLRQVAGMLAIDEGIIEQRLRQYRPPHEFIPRANADSYNSSSATPHSELRTPNSLTPLSSLLTPHSQPLRVFVDGAVRHAGRVFLRQIWQDEGALSYLLAEIPLEDYPDPLVTAILAAFDAAVASGRDLAEAAGELPPEESAELSRAVMTAIPDEDLPAQFDECMKVVKRAVLKNKFEKERLRAASLDRAGDTEGATAALMAASQLEKEMDGLK